MRRPRCSDPSCRRGATVKGLCHQHYQRIVRGLKITGPIRAQHHRERPPEAAPPGALACSVLNCGRKVAAMGMCWGHYRRQLRGDPVYVDLHRPEGAGRASAIKIGPKKAPYRQQRLATIEWWLREGLVTPEPNTGCLLWLGNYNPVTGYPAIGHNADGRQKDPWGTTGHRAALWFSGVKLEHRNPKMHARHLCNNPGCVAAAFNAPVSAHVVYGTAKENMADRTKRYERGELDRSKVGGRLKLTESVVAYIWAAHDAGVSVGELSADLGLSRDSVYRALRSVALYHQHTSQAA